MREWINKLEKIFMVVALAEGGCRDMALDIYQEDSAKGTIRPWKIS